jgi:ferrous-iron efflux pump FieF
MMHKEELLAIGNDKLRRLATYASVSVAIVLIAAKLVAYFMTDSVAMLSSLLDSTIDLIASVVTVYGVANALRPPDREHRFGHGKAEPLAALAQAAFIVGSSVLLAYEALSRFYNPHEIHDERMGYGVMGLAIALTIILILFQRYVIRRTGSMAISADRFHYVGDLAVNLAVIAAFGIHEFTGWNWLDPTFALIIAFGLMGGAWHIATHALTVLMDHELPDNERAKIRALVTSLPYVKGLHDMRTRSDSDRAFIELHVEMDATMTLRQAHEVAENIEEAVQKSFPNADVLIHQDPAGVKEPRLDEQIEANVKAAAASSHHHHHH